jgi:hypothetical protein
MCRVDIVEDRVCTIRVGSTLYPARGGVVDARGSCDLTACGICVQCHVAMCHGAKPTSDRLL